MPALVRPLVARLTAALTAALAVVLAATMVELPREPGGLTRLVEASLEEAGVGHAVTAVLLDFRAYDTWLEIGVLLLAALGALALSRRVDLVTVPPESEPGPILAGVAVILVPLMVLVGGYLLWLGTHAPGGAFQGGAVIAAGGILLLLAGRRGVTLLRGRAMPAVLAIGFITFLAAGVATVALGRVLLDYPPEAAGGLIITVEVAVTVAIAVGLATLFAAARRGGAGS
jgi:multisubunit Na+/H+ antiporter MnhB subunit